MCGGQRRAFQQEEIIMDGMKNISKAEVLTLRDQVSYQSGQVVSRTLAQNEHVSVTLFSFDKGEEISTHESGGDAMVTCLDGVGKITVDGVEHILHEGESIVMPARHPHAVYGQNPGCNQGGIAVIEGNGTRPSHKGDGYKESDVMYTLNATEQHAVAFADIHATLSANDGPKGPSSQMMGNPHENFVGEPAYGIGRPAMNQGYNAKFSFQIEEEVEPTIVAAGASGVAHPVYSSSKASFFTSAEEEMANTLVATDYKDPPIVNEPRYIVRRLTPTECARLQGFPDWWCDELGTENPTDEDISIWREIFQTHTDALGKKTKPKTDNQIRKWLKNPHSDSAEYKMWGNGVALPNVVFVLSGIAYYAQNHDG